MTCEKDYLIICTLLRLTLYLLYHNVSYTLAQSMTAQIVAIVGLQMGIDSAKLIPRYRRNYLLVLIWPVCQMEISFCELILQIPTLQSYLLVNSQIYNHRALLRFSQLR